MRPDNLTSSATAPSVTTLLDAVRGIDGSVAAAAIAAICLSLVVLMLVSRWRAARITSFPGLREVNAWGRAATATAVGAGIDTLDEVRVLSRSTASAAHAPTVFASTMESTSLVELRAELHERIDAVQRRILTAVVIGVLLGMVLGLLL
jgi:high-affinity Fe2+/Pb2+ permease